MKVRQGFVSNSSSASFIIKTSESKDTILRLFAENSKQANMHEIYSYLKEREKTHEKYDDSFWVKIKAEVQEMLDMFEHKPRMIGSRETTELYMDIETQEKLVEKFFKFRHLWLNEDDRGNCTIESHISMYNGWDDFGPLIQEAIYLLTVTNTPFTWETEED